ncbi:FAD/FMN-containing dehydrogenase [Nocardia sp. GAS34]|uniref:FAD-binding oxidoreductase n=1 Tax=unclassified Nocardia TaxID=2637762 RepID=UPI003D227445
MIENTVRTAIEGRVWLPHDDDFDRVRQPWNLTVEQPAAAVAEPADVDDMVALVRYARKEGIALALQPNGHGASGNTDRAIVVRTNRFDEVSIDPTRRVARVGAGVAWGRVLAAAEPHGLIGLAGSSPVVSVIGYTLGGGMSWFGRAHGIAANSVRAFEVVDSFGDPARVTADSDPDLFWALRGGGGDFAIVTAVEFELFPAPNLYGGHVMWDASRTREVLAAYLDLVAQAPAELTVFLNRLQFPGVPGLVGIAAAYLGDAAEGRELLRGFDAIAGVVNDSRGAFTASQLGAVTSEPIDPGYAMIRTELLTDLDEHAQQVLFAGPIDPLFGIQLRQLGGALAEPGTGAHPAVTEPYAVYLQGLGPTAEAQQQVRETQRRVISDLGHRVSGRKPFTSLGAGDTPAATFEAGTLDRLGTIKRQRDPHNVFRSNFPVAQAALRAI